MPPRTKHNVAPPRFGGAPHHGFRPSGRALTGGGGPGFYGGDVYALGWRPGLSPEQAVAYDALLNAGASPQFALAVARSHRASQIISRLTPGQIFQILGFDLTPDELIHQLEGGIAGSILGSILGSFVGSVEGPYGAIPGAIAGGIIGGAGGTAYNQAGALGGSHGQPSVAGHGRSPVPQEEREEGEDTSLPALARDVAQGVRFGTRFANQVGSIYNRLFGSSLTQPPEQNGETPPESYAAPAAQDYYPPPAPSEVPDYELPAPQPDFSTPAGENTEEIPQQFEPDETGDVYSSSYAAPDPFAIHGQPSDQPTGNGGPVFANQTGDLADRLNQMRAQLNQEIEVEQTQQQQKAQQGRQRAFNRQIGNIQRALDHLQDQEGHDPQSRDIPAELQQKQNLARQLDNLQNQLNRDPSLGQGGQPQPQPSGQPTLEIPGGQPQSAPNGIQRVLQRPGPQGQGQPSGGTPVTFCVDCDSQEDAILFLNGEPNACNVVPGSTRPSQIRRVSIAPPDVPASSQYRGPYNPDSRDADTFDMGCQATDANANPFNPDGRDSQVWDEGFEACHTPAPVNPGPCDRGYRGSKQCICGSDDYYGSDAERGLAPCTAHN